MTVDLGGMTGFPTGVEVTPAFAKTGRSSAGGALGRLTTGALGLAGVGEGGMSRMIGKAGVVVAGVEGADMPMVRCFFFGRASSVRDSLDFGRPSSVSWDGI